MKKPNPNIYNSSHFVILVIFLIMFLFLSPALSGQVSKIELFPYMVTNETNDGDATLMVDEQNLSGDPLNGDNFYPQTGWTTSYGSTYPLAAYIDIGQEIDLQHIFIFDLNGIGDLIIEYGGPGNWTHLLSEPLNKYKRWKRHDVNVSTRFIRVVKTQANPKFTEIVIYANGPVSPAISNLTSQNPQVTSIDLSWTDVEGNESTGILTTHDLRYSLSEINEDNFYDCNIFNVDIQPYPGKTQVETITGLMPGTKYFFAIKETGENGSTAISNIVSATTTYFENEIEEKLFLDLSMVTNETDMGDAGNLVNEQELSGDPLNGNGGTPVIEWKPSNDIEDYPASAYLDFGGEEHISKVFLRDINSMGDVVIEYGTPDNWEYLLTDHCELYLKWKQHDVDVKTKYLRITLTHREAKFSEIVLYRKAAALIEEKLILSTGMLTNQSDYGDAWKLVDEQEIAGDPANSPGGNPTTYWQTGFQSSIPYPLYAVVDLGKIVEVTKLFIRDTYAVSDFTIWSGTEENWELVALDNLSGYLCWNQHDINTETRFLRFGKTSPNANVAEIVVYGIDHTPGILDDIPPGNITDLLAVLGNNPLNEINLSWTAPGNDDMTGICSAYEIRFSTSEICQDNFYEATNWPLAPDPSEPGTTETTTIQGLNPATKYYFAIRAIDDNFNKGEISQNATCTTEYEIGGDPFKISLTPDMVLNEYAQGNASMLVDEQSEAGDPLNGNGGTPSTVWNPGSTDWVYPCFAMIDLKGLCNISKIFLYDADGDDGVDVFIGEPFNWIAAFTDNLENTNTWNSHNLDLESRFIRIQINSEDTKISEIVVYASRLEEIEAYPEPTAHERPTMDQLIGINAFINDPLGKMSVAGFVREYHSWMWCEGNNDQSYPGYPDNENKFNVMGWNFDYYYENFKNSGITACPAIQRNVLWLTDFNYSKLENKPVLPEENPELPQTYAEHADHFFQYAARYGNAAVEDNLLKLSDGQDRHTGKGTLNYYESWNEQDKWWKGRDAFFTPYEYAAMASADMDGHLGTMGNTLGVKNADENAKLVMGGLANPDLNYVKAIKLWADYNRNGDMPIDVINVHHYCNDGHNQSSGSVGVSPEEGNLKGLMQEFVAYRDKFLPGKEVWITEFGYDTHPESVQRAPAIGSFSQEEVQAQWLVRSFLELAASGTDKAAMYMLRDVNPTSTTKFNTSGLVGSASENWAPKPSWYYVYTLKNRLEGMKFNQEISTGNQNIQIYKFINTEDSLSAYALWCPTSNQTTVEAYEFSLSPNETQARLIELTDGNINGTESLIEITNGKITLNISERPVFVLAASADYTFQEMKTIAKLQLDNSIIVNESGQGDPTLLIDEQELSGDPFMEKGGEAITTWSTSFGANYPVHAYLDLGNVYDIETIFLRDMNATGNMTFSIGEPGNWTEVAGDNCGRYKIWSHHVIKQESRYLRITKYEPTANFSEIIIYVKD